MRDNKKSSFIPSIRRLLKHISEYSIQIYVVILCAILSTAFNIIGPKYMAKATDEIVKSLIFRFTGKGHEMDYTKLGHIMLMLVGLYIVALIFGYIESIVTAKVATGVSYDLRKQLIYKIHNLPIEYFNKESYGDVLSRLTNDVDAINTTLSQTLSQGISSFATVVGVLIMMLTISIRMTLISLAMIPVIFILVSIIIKKSQVFYRDQQYILGDLNGKIEEDFSGQLIIKSFNQEGARFDNFQKTNVALQKTALKATFLSGLMQPVMNIVTNIGYVFVVIVGAALVSSGALSVGSIQAFIQYLRNFTSPIAQLGNILNQLQLTAAASDRIFEILDEDEEVEKVTDESIDLHQIKGDVKFNNVRFGYNKNSDDIVIKDFSAHIPAGQKVAIVGPTGAGKTTIVKLLMGFYDLLDGEIKIDDHNINSFSKEDLRDEFTMVLQDTWLFNGTIMENIRYGNLNVSDEDVYRAAKAAQVDHFISTLPDGYDTVIDEEASNVSQGQKQLITIARAMVAKGSILILDEATSSVDTRTEVKIQKAMEKLMKNKTSFIIAHRLSTIRDADSILVMRDGDIVEQGSHDELIDFGGFYKELYDSQF